MPPSFEKPDALQCIQDVRMGSGCRIGVFVNLYGCEIGDNTLVGSFVEIQRGATVGSACKISSHSFVCEGVTIEDDVFIGHGVLFTNDRYPRSTDGNGRPLTSGEWKMERTVVRKGASIGSGAVILPGVEIGECAIVGAGAVVTESVPQRTIVAGVPARVLRAVPEEPRPNENP